MKKILRAIVPMFFICIAFSSCQSKEEKVIDQLDNLSEKIEKKSADWDSEQWQDAFKELEAIHSEMADCDFSDEQLKKLGEVEGQLTAVMIKKGVPALGNGLNSLIEGAGSFVDGFKDGVQEGSEESIEEIGNYVNGALDKLKELDSED